MTDLAVIINGAGTRFTLIEDHDFPDEDVVVPAGYRCDFASVPRALWFWLPPLGRYQRAALLHDYLYDCHHAQQRAEGALAGRKYHLSRRDVDVAFLRQMKRDGVGWRTRWPMYLAVRAFGGPMWGRRP